jgi:hypothetical protein
MRCRVLLALVAAVAAVPAAPRADDWSDGRPSDGYDVSVDLQGSVTFDTFQGALQPYGDWVVVGSYGQVWRPRVAAGWRPYYYGSWEWTNEGWMWVSDEPWGWAAYHYGRWAYDPYYGWLWVPGYEWAPAWVSWRVSGDVIGWAPLAPGFSVYVSSYPFIDFWWTFVPCVRFVSVPVHTVAYAPGYARRWFDATAPAPARPRVSRPGPSPAPAWGGPAPRVIEQRIGRPVTPARIVRAPAPGERGRPGEIPVYRPERPGRDDGPPRRGFAPREERAVSVPGGAGRGPGPVQAPGWGGRGDGGERRGGERGGGWRPEPRGGGQAATPPPSGGGGGNRNGWSGGRGSDDGQRGGWSGARGGGGGGGGGDRGARSESRGGGGGSGGGRVRPEGRERR